MEYSQSLAVCLLCKLMDAFHDILSNSPPNIENSCAKVTASIAAILYLIVVAAAEQIFYFCDIRIDDLAHRFIANSLIEKKKPQPLAARAYSSRAHGSHFRVFIEWPHCCASATRFRCVVMLHIVVEDV